MDLFSVRGSFGCLAFAALALSSEYCWAQSSFPNESTRASQRSAAAPEGASSAPAPLTPRLRPRPGPPPSSPPPPSPAPASPSSAPAPAAPTPAVRLPAADSGALGAPTQPPAVAPVAGFAPPLLPALRNMDPPPGYSERMLRNRAMLVGGGLVLGVTYGTSILYGAGQNFENGLGALAVPVLGPWLSLGARDFTCNINASDVDDIEESQDEAQACIASQTATAGILVGLGVGQLVGTALLTVGLFDSRKQWIRTDLAGVETRWGVSASPGFTGVTAVGHF